VAGLSKAVLSCQRAQVPALLWLRQLGPQRPQLGMPWVKGGDVGGCWGVVS